LDLVITLPESEQRLALFGPQDRNLRMIRDLFGVHLVARDANLRISGEPTSVGKAAALVERLQQVVRRHGHLRDEDFQQTLADLADESSPAAPHELRVYRRETRITPKTAGQRKYVEAVQSHDLVFCLGPAGTGKTYLAVAAALAMLKEGRLKRLVLARPAVEAGEKLGYLPGDLQAKVNPYLRPLFDAINDMMDFDQFKRMIANDVIEVIPLAFMRGRTLNNAAIILDEAQNTTVLQMLMFLTRMGHHSKMIVTGDDSQIDLDRPEKSGLVDAVRRLRGVKGIAVVRLDRADIVRHALVTHIVEAYGGIEGAR
jgi:phosphate starvation-inducible PhoH-like protein